MTPDVASHASTASSVERPTLSRFCRTLVASTSMVLAALIGPAIHSHASILSIEVAPESPSTEDNVTVTAKGGFPDYCWQVTDMTCGSVVDGALTIDVYAVHYSYGKCEPFQVLYEAVCALGSLPPGHYTMRVVEHHEYCDDMGCSPNPYGAEASDTFTVTATSGLDLPVTASRLVILPPRPNPFASRTAMTLVVLDGAPATARLEILDVTGHRVRQLPRFDALPGRRVIEWDGRDDDGRPARAGVYFFTGSISGRTIRTPVVVLR